MAKKKKIDVRAKVHFKKPVANCGNAAAELARIKKNEQSKIYRLEKKLHTTTSKTAADRFRREIRTQRGSLKSLSVDLNTVKRGCQLIDAAKAEKKSLKLKVAAVNRKLAKMYESREFDPAKHKELNNQVFRMSKSIAAIDTRIKGTLYEVNKKLKFDAPEIAEKLNLDKDYLEKHHHEDFDNEYWDEYKEKVERTKEEKEAAEEEEAEPDRLGYVEQMDEFFWQVAQDFDKNESPFLDDYNRVTFEWGSSISPGDSRYWPGSNKTMIQMTASDMWRWAAAHESYIRTVKLQNVLPDGSSTKLKYISYWDKDGKPV